MWKKSLLIIIIILTITTTMIFFISSNSFKKQTGLLGEDDLKNFSSKDTSGIVVTPISSTMSTYFVPTYKLHITEESGFLQESNLSTFISPDAGTHPFFFTQLADAQRYKDKAVLQVIAGNTDTIANIFKIPALDALQSNTRTTKTNNGKEMIITDETYKTEPCISGKPCAGDHRISYSVKNDTDMVLISVTYQTVNTPTYLLKQVEAMAYSIQ